MKLAFDVGVQERHQVEFTFHKQLGWLTISVDGRRVRTTLIWLADPLVRTYDLTVGTQEQHAVRIEKHRKQMFGAFQPQQVYAFVDGQLVAQGIA